MRGICAALAAALVCMEAGAQSARRLETIEVTGSHVRRLDFETVAPVEIITRERIERSGHATVAEVLRRIPVNVGASFNESFTNSFAPGASGISLRGLGQKATLVLLNGRRIAGYGFAQNLQDTFVDLNSIPTAAVERIEVLKDGASAIYGSDAIAGVVNVILRRDYRGAELGSSTGYYEGKHDYRFAASAGTGDVGRNGYTFLGTFDYYKRDHFNLADTPMGLAGRDRRGQQGGRNHQYSLTAGGTWAAGNRRRAIAECRGRVVTATEAVELGLIGAPLGSANLALNQAGNSFCAYEFGPEFAILPKAERLGFFGRAGYAFSRESAGYLEVGLNRETTFQRFQAPFFAGAGLRDPTPAGFRAAAFNINFAPGVAGNPFGSNAQYQGLMNDAGTRDAEIVSDTVRLLGSLGYIIGPWDFDSAIGWSRNEVDDARFNLASRSGIGAAFNVPVTLPPPVPVSTSASYNLDRFSLNSPEARARMVTSLKRRSAVSDLGFVDTRASTELGQLAGGPLGFASGIEFRRERLRDGQSSPEEEGDILGFTSLSSIAGRREAFAAFAEVAAPVTRSVEAQVAARYDHYSDYGSSLVPKVGFKGRPWDRLLLRATWGKGFRAPTLPEIASSEATLGGITVVDPLTGSQVGGLWMIREGNAGLDAEKSTNAMVGIVLEPARDLSVGIDAYRIGWRNRVVPERPQAIVDAGGAGVVRDPATGTLLGIITTYRNVGAIRTRGIDLDVRYRMRGALGRWTAGADFTYVDSHEENGVEQAGSNGGSFPIPRLRGYVSLDWDWQALSATARYNYVRGMKQRVVNASWFTAQDPRFQSGILPRRMDDYRTLDLFAAWRFDRHLKVTASVINVFNEQPPYDPSFGITLYDFSNYDVRGVQYRLGVTWSM